MDAGVIGESLILLARLTLNEKIARRLSLQFSYKPPTDLYDFPELDQIILEKGIDNVYHTVQQQYQYESRRHFYRPLMQRVMQIRAQEPLDPVLVIDPVQRELHHQRVIFAARQQIIISYVEDPRTVMASFIQKFPMGEPPEPEKKREVWKALAGVLEYSLSDAFKLFGLDSGDKVLDTIKTLFENNYSVVGESLLGGALTFYPLICCEWFSSEARVSSGDVAVFAYSYMRFVWGLVAAEVLRSRLNKPEMQELLHFFIYLFVSIMSVYFIPESFTENNNPTRFGAPYLELAQWGSYAPLMGYVAGQIMRRNPPSPELLFIVHVFFSGYVVLNQKNLNWLIGQLGAVAVGGATLVAAYPPVVNGMIMAFQGLITISGILGYMIYTPSNLPGYIERRVMGPGRKGVFTSFIFMACTGALYHLIKYSGQPTPAMVHQCNVALGYNGAAGGVADYFVDNVLAQTRNSLKKDAGLNRLKEDAKVVLRVLRDTEARFDISAITILPPAELKNQLESYCPWILQKIMKDPLGPLLMSVLGPDNKPIVSILLNYTTGGASMLTVERAAKDLKALVNNATTILSSVLYQNDTPSHNGLRTGTLFKLLKLPSLAIAVFIGRVAMFTYDVFQSNQGIPMRQQVLTMGAGENDRFVAESIERFNAMECNGRQMEYDEFVKRLVLPSEQGSFQGSNQGDFRYTRRWLDDIPDPSVNISNYKVNCFNGGGEFSAEGQERLGLLNEYIKLNLRGYSPVRKVSLVVNILEKARPQTVYGANATIIRNPQFREFGKLSPTPPPPLKDADFFESLNSRLDQIWPIIIGVIGLKAGGGGLIVAFMAWWAGKISTEIMMNLAAPTQIYLALRSMPSLINYILKEETDIGYVPREMLQRFGVVFEKLQRFFLFEKSRPGPPSKRAHSSTEAKFRFDDEKVKVENRMAKAYIELEGFANIWGFWTFVDSFEWVCAYYSSNLFMAFLCFNFASTLHYWFEHDKTFKLYAPSSDIPERFEQQQQQANSSTSEVSNEDINKQGVLVERSYTQLRENINKNKQLKINISKTKDGS